MTKKYGTEIMTDEECLLFVDSTLDNGMEVKDAIEDMKMIDNLLMAKRTHLLSFGSINKTRAGYARKGTGLYDTLMSIVDARAKKIKM